MFRAGIALFVMLVSAGIAQNQVSDPQCVTFYTVAPTYPKPAYRARVSGRTTVEVKVVDSGAVDSVAHFDGDIIFKQSSEEAAKAWMFQRSSQPNRRCKLIFVFTMMPSGTRAEDLTTRFTPPFQVEIRHEISEPTVLSDPAPDSPQKRK
jgi:hypothetical protein